jgi:hypothetical protein
MDSGQSQADSGLSTFFFTFFSEAVNAEKTKEKATRLTGVSPMFCWCFFCVKYIYSLS